MRENVEKLVDEKIKQISAILKCKDTDLHIGQIIAAALDKVNPEKGMGNYYLSQIDIHNRALAFEKRIEFFDKLFDFLEENKHTKDNTNISEHDSAWFYKYDNYSTGKVRKVIAINNMMGSFSCIFIKEEYFIGEEDWSKYFIVRAYDKPDEFFKEDCGRKSIKTLMKNGKLSFFEQNYANEDTRLSFDYYEGFDHDSRKFQNDYEKIILRYDCDDSRCSTYYYFNSAKSCEYVLGQLESAYWMRIE